MIGTESVLSQPKQVPVRAPAAFTHFRSSGLLLPPRSVLRVRRSYCRVSRVAPPMWCGFHGRLNLATAACP